MGGGGQKGEDGDSHKSVNNNIKVKLKVYLSVLLSVQFSGTKSIYNTVQPSLLFPELFTMQALARMRIKQTHLFFYFSVIIKMRK